MPLALMLEMPLEMALPLEMPLEMPPVLPLELPLKLPLGRRAPAGSLAGGGLGTLSLHVYILVSFIEYLMLISISLRFGPSTRFGGRIVGDSSLDIGAVFSVRAAL